jgi:hypothetical protein
MNQHFTSTLGFIGSVAAATLAAALMSGNAMAEGPIGEQPPFAGMLSRAQVQAELQGNRQLVSSMASEWALQQHASLPASQLTRDEVRAEYIASRDQVRATTGEDSGSSYFAQAPAAGPSATVMASNLR